MTNPDKKLGERIRELRTRLGITQKELAGDKITRNMLSLIESGNASPSVSTLLYISERLGTSAGYFFTSTAKDEGRYFKISIIDDLKTKFKEKKYRECEEICESIPQSAIDDELSYIAAVSYLNSALEFAETFAIGKAVSMLARAKQYAEKSIYADNSFHCALEFHGELFRTVCEEPISAVLCDYKMCGPYVSVSIIQYFAELAAVRSGGNTGKPCDVLCFAKHIRAASLLSSGKANEAIKVLRELSLDPSLPYFMKYRVLCGLEEAANNIGDFRLAYSSSRRKLEMIEKCKSISD